MKGTAPKLPLPPGGSGPPSNMWFSGPNRVQNPNGISIGSAVFAELRKNEETRLDAFATKGLRKILRVSWTANKTNEWILNKAGVKRELIDSVIARKLAYYGHTMMKQRSCLEKEIMQGTTPGARRRERPRTAWMDIIKTWTGLQVEE